MAYPNNISVYRANYDTTDYDAGRIIEESILPYANLFFPYFQNSNPITIDCTDKNDTDLLTDNLTFFFKESMHVSKYTNSLSNAFCFGGQNLSFYIAKDNNLMGYIDEQLVYCKTVLDIYITDVLRGSTIKLCSFSDFTKNLDDTSRYFSYAVPQDYLQAHSLYGLFGVFVLNIKMTNEFYTDKTLETKYPYHNGTVYNSLLQLLTFSATKEAIDVVPDVSEVFLQPVLTTDNFIDLYNKSIFPSIDADTTLTNDQKQSVIADQISALFIAQHPVVTGDYYPSKIIGLGGSETVRANKSSNIIKDINYGQRYEVILMAKNRLFNLAVTYNSYNFIKDIEKEFSTFNRSSQKVRDPARIMMIDENGDLDASFGVNGIAFNPFTLNTSNIEFLSDYSDSQVIKLDLFNNSVEITNINATRTDDSLLISGDSNVKVSFSVVYGNEKINRIRYSIITKNNLTLSEYIDDTGLTTSHEFHLSTFGGVEYSLVKSDLVKVKIDIEDVEGYVNIFYGNIVCPNDYSYNGVLEISATQSDSGSGNIIVDYLYQGTGSLDLGTITLQYSVNNSSWLASTNVIGDNGSGILPGWKRMVWNPTADFALITDSITEIYIRLLVSNLDSSSKEIVHNSSNIVVFDRVVPQLYVRKLSADENPLESSTSSISS